MSASGAIAAADQKETEKLVEYQELTGVDDLDQCRLTLERHNWNVEAAVLDTLNEADGMHEAAILQEQEELHRAELLDDDDDGDEGDDEPALHAALNQQQQQQRRWQLPWLRVANVNDRPVSLLAWGRLLILLPFQWFYSLVADMFDFTRRMISAAPPEDGAGDVANFLRYFRQKYKVQHPSFYQGTYSQAVADAKKELRFLFVYLHSRNHQDTDEFCSQSLCDSRVLDIINTNGLFWACDVESAEGYKVSRALRESTYPFVAVIVLKNNQMTVVSRIEGHRSGIELHQALFNAVRDNEAFIIAARADREERNFNQTLREEQDRAYRASLLADQEKARRRQAEEERQQQTQQQLQQKEQQREEEAASQSQAVAKQRAEVAALVPEEPSEQCGNTVRVLIKMPSGARFERRFLRSQSIKVLYYYVISNCDAPLNFHITTNFPRRVLQCEPTAEFEPPTFEAFGFGKSEMLYVQDTDS